MLELRALWNKYNFGITLGEEEIRIHEKKIDELIENMECQYDFMCTDSESKEICRAKNIGLESYLQCEEKSPYKCNYSLPFGESNFCKCPLRMYLSKELKI